MVLVFEGLEWWRDVAKDAGAVELGLIGATMVDHGEEERVAEGQEIGRYSDDRAYSLIHISDTEHCTTLW